MLRHAGSGRSAPRTFWLVVTAASAVLLLAPVAAPAQLTSASVLPSGEDRPDDPLDIDRWFEKLDELERWMLAYQDWRDWADRWLGKREPGWFTGMRDRRPKPEPPDWLPDLCAELVQARERLRDACELFADWQYDGPPMTRPAAVAAVADETDPRTRWWEHVHVDALWPVTTSHATALGVAGVHASIAVAGRLHVFVAPGLMFLNLPASGDRQWTAAAHWGIGYELAEFRLPGIARPAALHVNVARAWLLGNRPEIVESALTIAGFSITFTRAP